MILPFQLIPKSVLTLYSSSALAYIIFFLTQKKKAAFWGYGLVISGWLLHTGALLSRGIASRSFAVSNLYESLNFFAWMIVLVYALVESRNRQWTDGVFVLPLVVALSAYASLLDPGIRPLPAVLKSRWMAAHVSLCFLSYACFTMAFCFALMYIWQEKELKSRRPDAFLFRLPSLESLDRLGYRAVIFGLLFLSLGIVSGSAWARQAWGAFWSWDPKETFSLVMWLLYLVYLHGRLALGWQGRKSACLAVTGFLLMLFTYFGVSYLLPGLHSYLGK